MSTGKRVLIVLAVFFVLLAYGVIRMRSSSGPTAPTSPLSTIDTAGAACQAWSAVEPILNQAIQGNDPTALYRLETGQDPGTRYAAMMDWAQLAYQRQQSEELAGDLSNLQGEVSQAANGGEPIHDLPVPISEVNLQCSNGGAPPTTTGPPSSALT